MKRSFTVLSVLLVIIMVVSLAGSIPAFAGNESGKTRVLIQFKPGQKAAVSSAVRGVGSEVHYEFDTLNTIAVSVPAAALAGLSHNPNVVLIEEDAPRYPISIMPSKSAPAAAYVGAGQTVPYGVDMVQARDVWDANRDGTVDAGAVTASNRTICIIDSGLYTGHEDLQGMNVLGGYTTISGGWSTDGSGHGSHVAGTISAMNNALGVLGVTPGTVKLYIVRVFGDDGAWAYSSSLIDAANRCASAGANIISMSLGGSSSNVTEKNGFANLYAQGILSIAAAGNDGTTGYSYPASYDSVVSIAAVDSAKLVADFSQKNAQVELAAPGVAVLSTVPYVEANFLTVDGVSYSGSYVDFAARGSATGGLVNGGRCAATGAWSGKVVLCERGDISFYDKVMNVQNSGGAAAVLYNNVPGGFLGTLGDGFSSTIPAISLSQEDGQFLIANKLGLSANVQSTVTQPASGYEYYDGTSMATPHASAVAALVWSSKPTATNAQVRAALSATAQDLGAAGRDTSYGYGLVQAKSAITYLAGSSSGSVMHVADLDATKTIAKSNWKAIIAIKVVDASGAVVSGATVSGSWSGGLTGSATCTTTAAGTCSVTTSNMKMSKTSVTFTVTNLTKTGSSYNSAANSDPDGDSTGTVITVVK